MFNKTVESLIQEAIARGDFDDLPNKGKPIDLTEYFNTPEELRMASSVLKSAGVKPPEVEVLCQIAELKNRLAKCEDNAEQAQIHALMRRFEQNPFSPPTVKASIEEVGEEIFNALIELGELVGLSAEVAFRKSDYEKAIKMVRAHLEKKGKITVAETRDLLGTSRRYVLALLEHLDASGVTRREGDFRVLR